MSDAAKQRPHVGSAFITASNLAAMAKIYEGMPLIASIPGSPAEQAGLRWGDIVVAVNGVPTPDSTAFLEARKRRDGGATVRFVRNGAEFEIDLHW